MSAATQGVAAPAAPAPVHADERLAQAMSYLETLDSHLLEVVGELRHAQQGARAAIEMINGARS